MKKTTINNNLQKNVHNTPFDPHKANRELLLHARKKQLKDQKEKNKNSFEWLTEHSRNF